MCCASATLTTAEQALNLSVNFFGVIFAIKKFLKYVYGRSFKILTDSLPVKLILELKEIPNTAAPKLQRWALFLAGYDFDIT